MPSMDSSMTLLSAHIQLLDTQLALIHIPLPLYTSFVQPILSLLLPSENRPDSSGSDGLSNSRPRTWPEEHPFVNISVTPIECSVACSRDLAAKLFAPIAAALPESLRSSVSITEEDFIVMQVDGEGLDAGQRVLELTSPLAMAGISIFFITTYFSDYILVPLRCRGQVVHALEERGFAFEQNTSTYINPLHQRSMSSEKLASAPSTPPPTTVDELQLRTFATLKRRNIFPAVDPKLRLVQCAGRKDISARSNSRDSDGHSSLSDELHLGLVKCLITAPHPKFLSVTLTDTDPASILLADSLLHNFPSDDRGLMGSTSNFQIPITLDLRELPMSSTGIVCGVAGRLQGQTKTGLDNAVEMSYLSTARAGTVMVYEDELDRALEALQGSQNGSVASNGDMEE